MKTLAFYYKYLAAAEPLTDVLFGKEVRNAAGRASLVLYFSPVVRLSFACSLLPEHVPRPGRWKKFATLGDNA